MKVLHHQGIKAMITYYYPLLPLFALCLPLFSFGILFVIPSRLTELLRTAHCGLTEQLRPADSGLD